MTKNDHALGLDQRSRVVCPESEPATQEFSDAFSLFDWGKMSDVIPHKAEATAILSAHCFEKIECAQVWRDFSKSNEALALRKASRLGGVFNELGEELQQVGLRTYYRGIPQTTSSTIEPSLLKKTTEMSSRFKKITTLRFETIRPANSVVFGRSLPDYFLYRNAPAPKKIPLEFCFYWNSGSHSSLFLPPLKDSHYWSAVGFQAPKANELEKWDFPLVEIKTKFESTERSILLAEALAISGLSAPQLQGVLLKSIWTAALLKSFYTKAGLELVQGKFEWGISPDSQCILVGALGPDELKVVYGNMLFSQDILKPYYQSSRWFSSVESAKLQAKSLGTQDWKKWVQEAPPSLPPALKEIVGQLYMGLAQKLTGRMWFSEAWDFERLVEQAQSLSSRQGHA